MNTDLLLICKELVPDILQLLKMRKKRLQGNKYDARKNHIVIVIGHFAT